MRVENVLTTNEEEIVKKRESGNLSAFTSEELAIIEKTSSVARLYERVQIVGDLRSHAESIRRRFAQDGMNHYGEYIAAIVDSIASHINLVVERVLFNEDLTGPIVDGEAGWLEIAIQDKSNNILVIANESNGDDASNDQTIEITPDEARTLALGLLACASINEQRSVAARQEKEKYPKL